MRLDHKQRKLEDHKWQGLVEHSHNLLKCSACGTDLLDVLVINPNLAYPDGSPVQFDYRADCPICGDHSFPVKIRGEVGIITLEDRKVVYEYSDIDGDTVYLRTVKGKTYD